MAPDDDELRAAVEDLASDSDDGTSDDEGDVALLGLERQPRGRELEEKVLAEPVTRGIEESLGQ